MADAVSIEQNNKIRAALGLKPLPVPGAQHDDDSGSSSEEEDDPASTLESREAMASENWKRIQDEAEAKRKREERNAAIKRARDLAQRNAKLEGATLGEAEAEDTKTWLMQTKKRQKKIEKERARRLAAELEERERAAEYSAADLAGIKVGHEIDDFGGGEDHILTLKDTTIDENEEEGDELENLDLREREKATERLELKKRKPAYDPTAENTGILAQYDEEIEGKKRKRFTLDSKGSTAEEREAKRQEVSEKLNKNVISLDLDMETPTSDYMDISEVKIKKPKKKKAKATKQRAVLDDDDIFTTPGSTATPTENAMDVDSSNGQPVSAPASRKWEDQNVSFVDDDDLQASLTRQRRAAFKKRQKARPEDIARQLREESSQTPMDTGTPGENDEEPGLVIDETSEFVSNLQKPTLLERPERQTTTPAEERRAKSEGPSIKEEVEEDGDVEMVRTYNDIEDEEDLKERIKREESQARQQISTTGLDEEATLDQGLGATLNMLKQRGLVKSSDAADHNSLLRDRTRFLQEKTRMETEAEKRARQQRERDRASGKLDRMSAREREEYARWENKQRDQQDARHMAEVFNREYKPDVQLKYVDEHGRAMNQKEAFKHLSHQFHGKGSGKMKTEKRLKKIEEEKKREAMSALDSSQHTGMNNAMGATARKNRQAGVRLG
ncbi:U4/U6-U5 snRNP complex subunit SNU66 [Aspergillus homomorphus CBS 101889]|uniref:Putative DNA binding protein SART-1 n=1 Tax=Aspergillus homomorphus (strain CBS 101889) TaxID=1450537 RepID=A0A395HQ57_ASPHC|nr:putative DNA binding protein SART-1 [Aspergillus homomorphus CBS 101889]RAL09746.1 putative DNA binding protein SART-1 [Aspergillus homomorphus CBS 101889]